MAFDRYIGGMPESFYEKMQFRDDSTGYALPSGVNKAVSRLVSSANNPDRPIKQADVGTVTDYMASDRSMLGRRAVAPRRAKNTRGGVPVEEEV